MGNIVTMSFASSGSSTPPDVSPSSETPAEESEETVGATTRNKAKKRAASIAIKQEKKTEKADADNDDVCAVCLERAVHPVRFDCCGHDYCFLCAKGLLENQDTFEVKCSLCRKPIPKDFLEGQWSKRSRKDLESSTEGMGQQQWFYEGRDGWWKFEVRHNRELEEAFHGGLNMYETLICGHVYTIDFSRMIQFRKDFPSKQRKIKRDVVLAECKGVAGMVLKK